MGGTPESAMGGDATLPAGVLPLTPEDPAEIGGYVLAGRLGAGGMGVVYLGRAGNDALAAIKVAHTGTVDAEEARARFRAEVAALNRVPARCTARPLVDGTGRTPPYIVTEYVAGRSLKEIVQQDGPLPPERLRALARDVIRALAAIHRAGLIHRDLKPANVLVTPDGHRVIDFGIAQDVSASGGPTGTGMVVGSVGWIAPERLSRKPASQASDVFCWGCLVAYAATARNPFGTGDAVEMAGRALFEPPDLTGLDPSLRPLVAAALTKHPGDRPTAGQVLARLSPADPLGADDMPDGTAADPKLLGSRLRKPRALAAACAASVTVAAAAAWVMTASGPPAAPAGDRPAARRTHSAPATTDVAVISRKHHTEPRRLPRTADASKAPPPAKPAGGPGPKHENKPAKKKGPPAPGA